MEDDNRYLRTILKRIRERKEQTKKQLSPVAFTALTNTTRLWVNTKAYNIMEQEIQDLQKDENKRRSQNVDSL